MEHLTRLIRPYIKTTGVIMRNFMKTSGKAADRQPIQESIVMGEGSTMPRQIG